VLPRGATLDQDAIDTARAAAILEGLATSTDLVVVSTGALHLSAGALAWAQAADSTIIVAARDQARRDDVQYAAESLKLVGVSRVGTVLADRKRAIRRGRPATPPPAPAQEPARQPFQETSRDPFRDSVRETSREPFRPEPVRDTYGGSIRDSYATATRDTYDAPATDAYREPPRETVRETYREPLRDILREPLRAEESDRDGEDPAPPPRTPTPRSRRRQTGRPNA
jgi:hypothetical protein